MCMKTFTQKEIALILGVQQPTISKYFSGALKITAKDALKLNRALGVPLEVWDDPKRNWEELRNSKKTKKGA